MRLFVLAIATAASTVAAQPYSWSAGAWSTCSATCDGGTQTRTLLCIDEATGFAVADALCPPPPPVTSVVCNTRECPSHSWYPGQYGPCSATCGGGTQSRTVTCIDDSTGAAVADSECTDVPPPSTKVCNTGPCPDWATTVWSACTQPCGEGTQTRTVVCASANGLEVDVSQCPTAPPAATRACQSGTCPNGNWVTGGWSACSAPCGGGTQTRLVVCADVTDNVLPDSLCVAARPPSEQRCNVVDCTNAGWQTGDWSSCSAPCGGGTQTRSRTCLHSGVPVPDSACSGPAPDTVMSCNTGACPAGTWQTGAWDVCSLSCGRGTQSRVVTCVDASGAPLPESACASSPPPTTQDCNPQTCPAGVWSGSGWGACSATCGGGLQTRTLVCGDQYGARFPDAACPPRPADTQLCNTAPCPAGTWRTAGHSTCSAACGGGLETREVSCVDATGVALPESACAGPPPADTRLCNTSACLAPAWVTGAWSTCSAHCGEGTHAREVVCVDRTGTVVAPEACPQPAPPSMEACVEAACPAAWETSAWSACQCLGAVQSRHLTCVEAGTVVEPARCTKTPPAVFRACTCTPGPASGCSTGEGPALAWLALAWLVRRRRHAAARINTSREASKRSSPRASGTAR